MSFFSILRRVRPNFRRARPRRGRTVDRKYLHWIHAQAPLVTEHDPLCSGRCYTTAHHVKECAGAQKNDHRTVPLPLCQHLHGFGRYSIEHGRRAWEQRYGINLDDAIQELREEYQEEKAFSQKVRKAL